MVRGNKQESEVKETLRDENIPRGYQRNNNS